MATTTLPEEIASVTLELISELQQEKPDRQLITWLITDQEADLKYALSAAHLTEEDLMKKPQLRTLQLQRYLRK